MLNLVVDIGNTFAKIAVFDVGKIIYKNTFTAITTELIIDLIKTKNINTVIVSSVKKDNSFSEELVASQVNYINFNTHTKIPIKNSYKTPKTLGLDRLAGVIGANHLFPNEPVLVVDAGTCITYDNVTAEKEYIGGSISPGIKMRFDALHHFTSKLPQLNFDEDFNQPYGQSSAEAISSGVINGCLYEAKGFIEKFLGTRKNGKIILCGGDSTFFDTKFKNSIFANLILHEPNLVLIGLNTVVNYQHDLK